MNNELSFAIAGGDERYTVLAGLLPRVTSNLCDADAIIFPVPFQWDDDVMRSLKPDQLLFSATVSAENRARAKSLGLEIRDYSVGEPFAVANALITAEGAIETAMRETKFTIGSSEVLIIGFGRIGKLLAQRLKPLCYDVSVYARSPADKAWIKAYGYGCSEYASEYAELSRYDIIFNTAPALMMDAYALSIARNALVIDLASKPGGVDYQAAEHLSVKVIHALSLPGKAAPITAAMIIRDALINELNNLRKENAIRILR
ncbi:MAG: dipicolinate synthase subunit DpsA [Oscillospiraceae bacterium]|jgi:dipicolinate synthase subunit A|nr:dipicolinate synthase subunit DpsA [Oscillospiraceae bacterium]